MSIRLSKVLRAASLLVLLAMLSASGCAPKAYAISGTITGDIVEGVPVYIAGTTAFVLTNSLGQYSIPVLVGTKKIIPQMEGYEFTPPERTVNGPSTTVDFVSSEVEELPYDVSGTITGVGVSGVTINVLGKAISTTSDVSGHYSLTGLMGSNTLVPSKSGYTYAPTQIIVTEASTNANFVGSETGGGSSIAVMSGGDGHTLAIKADGSVLASGYNSCGQLGINSDEDSMVPVQVPGLSNVTDAACGASHSAAISNGDLYTWGWNVSGQLGDGGTTELWVPTQVTAIPDAVFTDVACGSDHTIALTADGKVYTFGDSYYSQLGRTVDESHPSNLPGEVSLTSFLPAVPIGVYAGDAHCLVLFDNGSMVGWGNNYGGVLGLGPSQPQEIATPRSVLISNVEEVSAGYYHTIVRNSSGELYIWGYNWEGEIGDGTSENCTTPKHVPNFDNARSFLAAGLSSFIVDSAGDVFAWGSNSSSYLGTGLSSTKLYEPTKVLNLADIERIYGGYDYTYAFESDGTMWGWGNNQDGQLGDDTWTSRPLPVQLNLWN